MENSNEDIFRDTRLSYSSARLLQGCERKYKYYKIDKIPKDEGVEDNYRAFGLGKAFHWILEVSDHKKPEKIGGLLEKCVQEQGLEEIDVALCHAMVLKYLRLRKTQNMSTLGIELELKDDKMIGYVDLVELDNDTGLWWISDLKTAKTFWGTTIARLPADRQLNLYASYAPQIAEQLGLDLEKFGGCRYKVTTKSTAKQRNGESYLDYVARLTDNNIKTYDVLVPKDKLKPDEVKSEHNSLHSRAMQIRNGDFARQNFGYCENYFKPCEYWSQCHGATFSDMEDGLEVFSEV